MTYQELSAYLLAMPDSKKDYPFGPDSEVFKIKEKVFAILGEDKGVGRVNLKCDPAQAIELRDLFTGVIPGYHMNKKHWNTVILDGSVPDSEIERMVDHSFALVVKGLKKAERTALEVQFGSENLYRA